MPLFLIKMHEKRGNFCIFPSKIAEKEGKTDLHGSLVAHAVRLCAISLAKDEPKMSPKMSPNT